MSKQLDNSWKERTKNFMKFVNTRIDIPAKGMNKGILNESALRILDLAIVGLIKQTRRGNFLLCLPSACSLHSKEGRADNKWSKAIYDNKTWAVRYAEAINEAYDIKLSGNLVECINNIVNDLVKLDLDSIDCDTKSALPLLTKEASEYTRYCFDSTRYLKKYEKDDDDFQDVWHFDDSLEEYNPFDDDYDDNFDEEDIEILVSINEENASIFRNFAGLEEIEIDLSEHNSSGSFVRFDADTGTVVFTSGGTWHVTEGPF